MSQKLRIFTDTHIALAIVKQLRLRGIDVGRCEDVGMASAKDDELLNYAAQNGYTLLSMDDDMTRLHAEWLVLGKAHLGIFYAPMREFQGDKGIGSIVIYCSDWAELLAEGIGTLEEDIYNQLLFIKK